ncbi:MAG: ROK family protein [Spirochaetota bacterium]
MVVFGALDLGGSNIRIALINQEGEIIWKSCKLLGNMAQDRDFLLGILEELLSSLPRKYHVQNFSFAVPCIVNPAQQSLTEASNITTEFQSDDIQEIFSQLWPETPLYFLNDVQAATLGEMNYGYLKHFKTGIYLNLGTGIACGLIIDGKLHAGTHYAAGEIAYCQPFSDENHQKGQTVLEDWVSGRAIERIIVEHATGECTSKKIQDIPHSSYIWELLQNRLSDLSLLLFNFSVLLNPEMIVVGGGMSSMGSLLGPILSKEFYKLLFPPQLYFTSKPQVIGLMGAAFYGMSQQQNKEV